MIKEEKNLDPMRIATLKRAEKMKEKDLEGSDISLNLKEINMMDIDSFNSLGCVGRVRFDKEEEC